MSRATRILYYGIFYSVAPSYLILTLVATALILYNKSMRIESAIGILEVNLDASERVSEICFAHHQDRGSGQEDAPYTAREREVAAQMEEYLSGQRTEFTFPFVDSGTEFQRHVYAQLRTIPYGERISYSALAEYCGRARAARAVAHAVASNPLTLLTPCHRVVRKDGRIGEYALHTLGARGKKIKEWLLALEAGAATHYRSLSHT